MLWTIVVILVVLWLLGMLGGIGGGLIHLLLVVALVIIVLNLLQGLLPLALNYRAGAGVNDEREMLDAIHEQLLGTCAGYAAPRQNKEP